MKLPIAYALDYPERKQRPFKRLVLSDITELTFYPPDKKFECLQLAYYAIRTGGSMPTVLNTANEIYVNKFLNKEISFLDIPKNIKKAMNNHQVIQQATLNEILALDQDLRNQLK
jgi:1-deoxy-D-xylulose-5-phosphate reductoisomerase